MAPFDDLGEWWLHFVVGSAAGLLGLWLAWRTGTLGRHTLAVVGIIGAVSLWDSMGFCSMEIGERLKFYWGTLYFAGVGQILWYVARRIRAQGTQASIVAGDA